MTDDEKQELGEVAAAIRAALYKACPDMPCYPVGIVEPHLVALRQHAHDQGYYDGSTHPIVQHDALREALVDLLHAVCGEKGFAQAVRWDSGRIYPWPALELAEAKALAALEKSK
jgi:hypothetical protein